MLLLVAAAGLYLYRNLNDIMQQQVRETFDEFGVIEYRLEGPSLYSNGFAADRLRLHGRYEQYDYELSLSAPEVRYDWRSLLTGQVLSVELADLAATVIDHGSETSTDSDEPTIIEVPSLLPQELLNTLPTQALAIETLRLDYRAPDGTTLIATGALAFRERLDLSLAMTLANSEITVSAHN